MSLQNNTLQNNTAVQTVANSNAVVASNSGNTANKASKIPAVLWDQNSDSFKQYAILTSVFGAPGNVDPQPGGVAIWRKEQLAASDVTLFGIPCCLESYVLVDEAVPHNCPFPHFDNQYAGVLVDISPEDTRKVVDGVSGSVSYDKIKRVLWSHCGNLASNIATLYTCMALLMKDIGFGQVHKSDEYRAAISATRNSEGKLDTPVVQNMYLRLCELLVAAPKSENLGYWRGAFPDGCPAMEQSKLDELKNQIRNRADLAAQAARERRHTMVAQRKSAKNAKMNAITSVESGNGNPEDVLDADSKQVDGVSSNGVIHDDEIVSEHFNSGSRVGSSWDIDRMRSRDRQKIEQDESTLSTVLRNEHLSSVWRTNDCGFAREQAEREALTNAIDREAELKNRRYLSTQENKLAQVLSNEHLVSSGNDTVRTDYMKDDDSSDDEIDEKIREDEKTLKGVLSGREMMNSGKQFNRNNAREYFCGRRKFDADIPVCQMGNMAQQGGRGCAPCNNMQKIYYTGLTPMEDSGVPCFYGRREGPYIDNAAYLSNFEENAHDPSYKGNFY